ncbi:MAG: DUF1565 domain-containing protein [Candidatus Andersenbacteria bacterium]
MFGFRHNRIKLKGAVVIAVFSLTVLALSVNSFLAGAPPAQVMGVKDKKLDTRPVRPLTTDVKNIIYVSTSGSDSAGNGGSKSPYKTISHALSKAKPSTRIEVQSGTYNEYIVSARSGSSSEPIILQAKGRVVLKGNENNGRIMELRHDYYIVSGFEFTGKDILLWLQEADHNVIQNNYFHHADGECVRMKYHSNDNLFEKNRVEHCGREDFEGDGGGKNGEGVYIGTAPEQLSKNPTKETDKSDGNIVRNNTFATFGNECVDVKEGSSLNIIEFNSCTEQKDTESGGMNSRGNGNIFRYNYIFNNRGAGIRFGGDESKDGLSNEAYGNRIENNKHVAVKVQRMPQGRICGNVHSGNRSFSNRKEILNPPCSFELKTPGVQK